LAGVKRIVDLQSNLDLVLPSVDRRCGPLEDGALELLLNGTN